MSRDGVRRLTMAQALVAFLKNQYSERDGVERPLFAGCLGFSAMGCVAGVGQALQQNPDFRSTKRATNKRWSTAAGYAKRKPVIDVCLPQFTGPAPPI